MTRADTVSIIFFCSILFLISPSGSKDEATLDKLKDNWTKFVKGIMPSTKTCYKSIADYGNITVDLKKPECDLRVNDEERNLCIKLDTKSKFCHAHVKGKSITITLTDATKLCEDASAALHMVVHSTSPRAGHSRALPQKGSIRRHLFIDPMVRLKWIPKNIVPNLPGVKSYELTVEGKVPPPAALDYEGRGGGGFLLLDSMFSPHRVGNKLLVSAADPRFQADTQVQWMGGDKLSKVRLTKSDTLFVSLTTCQKHRTSCSKPCSGHLDAQCNCQRVLYKPQTCTVSSRVAPACNPEEGNRALCPYGTVVGADVDPLHKVSKCDVVLAVVNGLHSVHENVRRYLDAASYPWPYFMVTILACVGNGRVIGVSAGFPSKYRTRMRNAQLPPDRELMCDIVRVYITNAEAQVTASHSFLTYENFCLDDLIFLKTAYLPRPRRPPPPHGGVRDAVHILLGRVPQKYADSVDLSRLVVKMYSEPPSSKVLDLTYRKLHSEYESESSCVVEVIGDNTTGTTPADRGSTTRAPLNFSMEAARMVDLESAGTGSALGILFLMVLFAYCMCQRTNTGDWESQSSWSESPASWTTSSSSSWTDTPISSDEYYSSDSFDFERDAHLLRHRGTLKYMQQVQEEATEKRRALGQDDDDD